MTFVRVGLLAALLALGACSSSDAATSTDAGVPDAPRADAVDAGAETSGPPPPPPARITCADAGRLTPLPVDPSYDPYFRALSPAKYEHGRCELVALVVDAALELRATLPGALPIGIGDLSQADGAIPGTDVKAPRHPAPSHTNGFSVDITYFRRNGRTLEDTPACPSKTREFCEGPHDVDVVPTARFMAHLARTKRVVQVIVDPVMVKDFERALDDLAASKVAGASDVRSVLTSGVAFHADHFHVSVSRACFDGLDNDGDGKIDLDDPDCADAVDDDEGK